MNSWLNAQLQALKLVLARMQNQVTSTLLIALVIGIAICLPGIFYTAIQHAEDFSTVMKAENEISLFVSLAASEEEVRGIEETLNNHPQIDTFHLVTKAEAWAAMQANMQAANQDVSVLSKNPLPDAFYVHGHDNDPETLAVLKDDLAQIPNIDHVMLNTDWSKRLDTLLATANNIIAFIALLLAIGLILIIGNTIRMQIMTQRDEIEVSYLIGATNQFIRTPFLYAGTIYGLLGGIIGVGIVAFSIHHINQYLANLSDFYNNDLNIAMLDTSLLIVIILTATAIGWLGAYIAVNRTISSIIMAYNSKP